MSGVVEGRGVWVSAPAERLATLRILVTTFTLVYLLIRLPHLIDVIRLGTAAPDRFSPVGPLIVLDSPVPAPWAGAMLAIALASGVAAVLGWRWRISGPLFAAAVLLLLSYRNSWGQVFHTENLVVLHLLILAFAPAADVWSLDRRRNMAAPPERSERYGWPIQLMVVVVAVAYVLAGWAKLRASGLDWVRGDALRNLVAHDALRKELVGDRASPIGKFVLGYPWVFTPMAALSLIVELSAPALLLGGRARTAWVAAAWAFHIGVLAIMGIMFPYQVLGVAFACCFAVESIPQRWIERRRAILVS